MSSMSEKTITVNSLSGEELIYVLRTFSDCIGISKALEDAAKSGGVLPRKEFDGILSKINRSGPNATSMELAWTSCALESDDHPRLTGYSVFWQAGQSYHDLELWIGRTPDRPIDEKSLIADDTLVKAIYLIYRLHTSSDSRTTHAVNLVKSRLRVSRQRLISYVVPLAVLASLILWRGFNTDFLIGNVGIYILLQPVTRFLLRKTDGQSAIAAYLGAAMVAFAFVLWLNQAIPTQVAIIIASMLIGGITAVLKYPDTVAATLGDSSSEAIRNFYDRSILPIAKGSFFSFAVLQVIVYLYEQPWSDVSYLFLAMTLVASVVLFDYLKTET